MTIGLVKEIKNNEFRVGLTPDNVKAYAESGCEVLVETSAGVGAGFEDSEYIAAGAKILPNAADIWNQAEMIVKVKEPVASEYGFLKEGQILYTYLHLAADRPLTDALLKAGTKAVAYETITGRHGGGLCLLPMRERCRKSQCCDPWRRRGWPERLQSCLRDGRQCDDP